MLAPADISAGLVSAADSMSPATSRLVNFIPDVAGVQRIRPALVSYPTTGLGASPLIGLYRWKTWIVGVTADRKIYAISDATPTVWGALSDATAATQLDGLARPVFAESPSFLYIAGGLAIQKWTGAGLTARLGGTSPNTTHIANLGQRLVGLDLANPGRYRYSDLGEGVDSSWPALNFITAESRPDGLRAITENTAELALFGDSTLEIHGISTDPLSPFQRINTLNLGCSAPYSIIRFDDRYFWLDDKRRIVQSDGRSFESVGDAIQRDLRDLGTVSDAFGYREDTDRNGCLVWVFPTAGRTWSYDYNGKKWAERATYDGVSANTAWPVATHAFWPAQNVNLVGASTTAGVYTLSTDIRQDLGGTILAELVTGWQDFGTDNRKRSARVRVVMRRGTTPLSAISSQLEVAVEDDGKGFSEFKVVDLGQPYDTQPSIDLHFGGIFRRRRYWVRYSGTDDISLAKLADDVIDLESAA